MSEADKIIKSLRDSGKKVEEFYMSNKTSDKNVGSIEEDIMILQEKDCMWHYPETRIEEAIENIIADYTRQKEINEEHQKINGELRERVKELENENISKQKAYDDCYCEYKHYKQFESISIQKIIEKIEELKKLIEKIKELKKLIEKIKEDNQYSNEIPLYEHDIKLLEELLQESEDK